MTNLYVVRCPSSTQWPAFGSSNFFTISSLYSRKEQRWCIILYYIINMESPIPRKSSLSDTDQIALGVNRPTPHSPRPILQIVPTPLCRPRSHLHPCGLSLITAFVFGFHFSSGWRYTCRCCYCCWWRRCPWSVSFARWLPGVENYQLDACPMPFSHGFTSPLMNDERQILVITTETGTILFDTVGNDLWRTKMTIWRVIMETKRKYEFESLEFQ